MYVCVCVCESEREREREKEKEIKYLPGNCSHSWICDWSIWYVKVKQNMATLGNLKQRIVLKIDKIKTLKKMSGSIKNNQIWNTEKEKRLKLEIWLIDRLIDFHGRSTCLG